MPETRKQLKGGAEIQYPNYTVINLQTGKTVEKKTRNESMTLNEFWKIHDMSNHIWEVK